MIVRVRRCAPGLLALAACTPALPPEQPRDRTDALDTTEVAAVEPEVAPAAEPTPPPPPPTLPPMPDPTSTPPPVRAIAVGEHISCALLEGGEVRCWGATRIAGIPFAVRPTPIGIADAVSLAVGDHHACVARVDGSVVCWGDNRDGQIGDGTTESRNTLTPVAGLVNIVEVAVSGHHSCARDGDGAVFCWGHDGCVGHARAEEARRPGRVKMPAATRLVAGDDITCAFLADGPPRCWGFNTTGLLHPHLGPVTRAIASAPLAKATVVALGFRHVCMAGEDRVVWCAGSDHHGQLGDQHVPDDAQCYPYTPKGVSCHWTERPPPDPPDSPDVPLPQYPPRHRPAPKEHTREYPDKQWFVLAGGVLATALGAGHGRSCAITPEKTVKCWGQWYRATDWAHRRPGVIAGVADAVAIAVAQEHACALLGDRTVRCWGYNRSGELGNGETNDRMLAAPAAPVRW